MRATPLCEETIKNDAKAGWNPAIKDTQKQPVTDESIPLFVEKELVRPSKELTFLVLSEQMADFDKLDKETQNQLAGLHPDIHASTPAPPKAGVPGSWSTRQIMLLTDQPKDIVIWKYFQTPGYLAYGTSGLP